MMKAVIHHSDMRSDAHSNQENNRTGCCGQLIYTIQSILLFTILAIYWAQFTMKAQKMPYSMHLTCTL